jgi:hypothetical protein
MATNAAPIYGKQFIRYAETWEAAVDAQASSPDAIAAATTIGIVEVGELRAVVYAVYAGPNVASNPGAVVGFTGQIVGINQAYMPTTLAQPYTARQLTVATSGLLLVEVDPTLLPGAITIATQLRVNNAGQAVAAGGQLASLDGTTPIVRENVGIGGRNLVLVSFA